MTLRTSLPRPAAPLTLVTGFLLASSAWAQFGAEGSSVYNRRGADAVARAPQAVALQPSPRSPAVAPPRKLYPQPPIAAGNPSRGPAIQDRQLGQRQPGPQQLGQKRPQLYPQPQRLPAAGDRGAQHIARDQRPQGGQLRPGALGVSPAGLGPRPIRDPNVRPAFFPAPAEPAKSETGSATEPAPASIPTQLIAAPGEHPLLPAVRWAKTGIAKLDTIQDYSCTMVKRERINGALGEPEHMFVKVRHEPFSVYVYFLGPAKVKGQEAIYVRGKNDGNIVAHPVGFRKKIVGTVSLKPDSMLAMAGNRYPMTELGLRRLTERLIEVGEHDCHFGECDVKVTPGAKINRRDCTCIEVVHPVPRREFLFHLARIYVDSEHNLPTRYEAYEWPEEAGGKPVLTEEYTYLNLKFNNGFTDKDFDPANPEYDFK